MAELHQGLSHALMAGVGKQLLLLQFAREPGFMDDSEPLAGEAEWTAASVGPRSVGPRSAPLLVF